MIAYDEVFSPFGHVRTRLTCCHHVLLIVLSRLLDAANCLNVDSCLWFLVRGRLNRVHAIVRLKGPDFGF